MGQLWNGKNCSLRSSNYEYPGQRWVLELLLNKVYNCQNPITFNLQISISGAPGIIETKGLSSNLSLLIFKIAFMLYILLKKIVISRSGKMRKKLKKYRNIKWSISTKTIVHYTRNVWMRKVIHKMSFSQTFLMKNVIIF